jgi:hypothetical protein
MLRELVVGFIIMVAGTTLFYMYADVTADVNRQNQVSVDARLPRPAELQNLKRAGVRLACTRHSDWNIDTCRMMDAKEVMIGMNAEQVRLAWGKPSKITVTTSADRQREQWIFGPASPRSYIYLDDDLVQKIQTLGAD